MILGWTLILIGGLLLLKELGYIEGSIWSYLFPILFIFIGIATLMGRREMKRKMKMNMERKAKKQMNSNVVDEQ